MCVYVYCVESCAHIKCYSDCSKLTSRKFFELISDDTYNFSDVHIINADCLYVTYKK